MPGSPDPNDFIIKLQAEKSENCGPPRKGFSEHFLFDLFDIASIKYNQSEDIYNIVTKGFVTFGDPSRVRGLLSRSSPGQSTPPASLSAPLPSIQMLHRALPIVLGATVEIDERIVSALF